MSFGVVVIVWSFDLQLPVQLVPITIKVVSSNPIHGEVYLIQHYVIKFVGDLRHVGGFLHHITEMLLKVALNTINHHQPIQCLSSIEKTSVE
jgi:hypothetical protein